MALVDQISADIKSAMLAREKEKLETLRAIKSALLLLQTSGEAVTPETEIKTLQKLQRQRTEAATIYTSQNRQDLADKELYESTVIAKYLPRQLSEEEITEVISSIVSKIDGVTIKDMGKVMAEATKQLAGRADGKTVSTLVKQLLTA
ncbi:MAG: GatB/YqeY domain-containing protein [Bacteroidetes bacterium]|nr:GatB/YqeY domain-containing protein [Bacteroidota bacterium]MBU1719538.1 GatB/YqeY domain-containing protein [Bacteroidota bacterium]